MLLFFKKNKNFISTAKQLTVNSTNFLQKIVDFSPNLWYLVVTQEVGYKKQTQKSLLMSTLEQRHGTFAKKNRNK